MAVRGPTFGSTGSASTTTFTVPQPAGLVAGDECVIYVVGRGAGPTFTATGFTAVAASTSAQDGVNVLYRSIDGTESWPVTITATAATRAAAAVIGSGGIPSAAVLDPIPSGSGTVNTVASTTVAVSAVTTGSDGDLLVWFAFTNAAANVTPSTITAPAGQGVTWTQQGSQTNTTSTTSSNVGVIVATAIQPVHGSTGAQNGTSAVSAANGGLMVALTSSPLPPAVVISGQSVQRAGSW